MRLVSTSGPALLRDTQNRRALVRYRCPPASAARVYLAEDVEFQRGWLLDLSREGAGLLLSRCVAVDTTVSLQIRRGEHAFELVGLVAHATAQGDGEWKIGLRLLRILEPDELEEILN